MTSRFNCPNCGGVNEYAGDGETQPCQYCGSNIPVPATMANDAVAKKLGTKAKVWIVLFIVVVFILPACIGFGGTILGVIASILGTIISVVASFFT